MKFYLARHGEAVSAAENPQRPLSLNGRRQVERTARLAQERKIQVARIYHSGIWRAQETAEILAAHLMPAAGVAPLAGLLPDDDPAVIKAEFEDVKEPILLVGHLPFMSRLAGLLVHGDPERPVVEFFPATLASFVRSATAWKIEWLIVP